MAIDRRGWLPLVALTLWPGVAAAQLPALGPAVEFDQDQLNWGKLTVLKEDRKELVIKLDTSELENIIHELGKRISVQELY